MPPLDARERAFQSFDNERPGGQAPLSGWERVCFIRGWDAAISSLPPAPPRKWWEFWKPKPNPKLLSVGDKFPDDVLFKGPFGGFIKVCPTCQRIDEIYFN